MPDVSEVLADSTQTTAIFESNQSAQNGFAVYPNPTNSVLHINYNDLKNTRLIVFDVYGKKIFEKKNCDTVNLSLNNKGLYLVELTDTVKNVSYTKVVVLQ